MADDLAEIIATEDTVGLAATLAYNIHVECRRIIRRRVERSNKENAKKLYEESQAAKAAHHALTGQ
jgi:hypothetical protein